MGLKAIHVAEADLAVDGQHTVAHCRVEDFEPGAGANEDRVEALVLAGRFSVLPAVRRHEVSARAERVGADLAP